MTKEWQPKVTAIKEAQNLNALSMITLFGKLKEHEHEILQLKSSEEELEKKGNKVIKATSSKASLSINGDSDSRYDSPSEEKMRLFVRCFNPYIQKNGLKCSDKSMVNSGKTQLKREGAKEDKGPNCCRYGNSGHLKSECPELLKTRGKSNSSD